MIVIFLSSLGLLLSSGLAAALAGKGSRAGELIGSWGAVLSGAAGAAVSGWALVSGSAPALYAAWNLAAGCSFSVELDRLSALFLLPVFLLSAVSALFGGESMAALRGKRNTGTFWLFFNILTASMALVVSARNAVLFLAAWEVMSLSSWVLVSWEDDPQARQAGIVYLVASQIGAAFLLVLFMYMGAQGQGAADGAAGAMASLPTPASGHPWPGAALDFTRFRGISGAAAGTAFILALVGFGTKAGIVPLHVWLPEAHPAAPSHVSAVMSGVMIKTGIYGLVRILSLLGSPPPWWGWTLLGIGAVSGILGVLFALAQHDLKRLLAYHSVENIGIICIGLGLGLLGTSYGMPLVAVLGFAGGLLHVVNHAMFKGLLFLGAGAVLHASGTRDLEKLGGLLKRMPVTGAAFLTGAAAITGLPPLNGFLSELLISLGAFSAIAASGIPATIAGALAAGSIAVIAGLAAACFAKAFGVTFLGSPRSPGAAAAHETGAEGKAAQIALAVACMAIGVSGPLILRVIAPLAASLGGVPALHAEVLLIPAGGALVSVTIAAAILAGITLALWGLRAALLSRRRVERAPTWDCGYVKPTSRMQYSASSFAQPLLSMFKSILSPRREGGDVSGLFPQRTHFHTETPDVIDGRIYRPAFSAAGRFLARLRALQNGRLQLYVLLIAAAIAALLAWRL